MTESFLAPGFFAATLLLAAFFVGAFAFRAAGRFRGRTLFSGMIYAPLVMPEVITGLSLLLLFIAIGLDRGVVTIVLAHSTFSMCYVSVVVSSRIIFGFRCKASFSRAVSRVGGPWQRQHRERGARAARDGWPVL